MTYTLYKLINVEVIGDGQSIYVAIIIVDLDFSWSHNNYVHNLLAKPREYLGKRTSCSEDGHVVCVVDLKP